jgi:PAS domain-containing protein
MPNTIRRLLKTHEFLHRALVEHERALAPHDTARLKRERDDVLLELLDHVSDDPHITFAQLNLFVSGLAALAPANETAALLHRSALRAAEQLTRAASHAAVKKQAVQHRTNVAHTFAQRLDAQPHGIYAILDSLPNRSAVFDRDYRYLFTSRANATFYGANSSEFIGIPLSSVIENTYFETATKPAYDRCFAGHSHSNIVEYDAETGPILYDAHFSPIRDQRGEVVSVLSVLYEVPDRSIPPTRFWPRARSPLFARSTPSPVSDG